MKGLSFCKFDNDAIICGFSSNTKEILFGYGGRSKNVEGTGLIDFA